MLLGDVIQPSQTLVLPGPMERSALFDTLAAAIAAARPEAPAVRDALTRREAVAPTSTPEGVAFPHAVIDGFEPPCLVTALVQGGVQFGLDHPPSDLIFCLAANSAEPWRQVRIVARLARLVHQEKVRRELRAAADATALYERLAAEDARHG